MLMVVVFVFGVAQVRSRLDLVAVYAASLGVVLVLLNK
jgi:hypothetical protein